MPKDTERCREMLRDTERCRKMPRDAERHREMPRDTYVVSGCYAAAGTLSIEDLSRKKLI